MNDREDFSSQALIALLLAGGISQQDIGAIADESIRFFDIRRKSKGAHNGAIGYIGRDIYRKFLFDNDHEADLSAFEQYRISSTDVIAESIGASKGAVTGALGKLIDCGFLDRQRQGRQFKFRLMLPPQALKECCDYWISLEEPIGSIVEYMRPIYVDVRKALGN